MCAALLLAVKAASLPTITDSCNQTVSSVTEMLQMASRRPDLAPDFVLCVELNSTVEEVLQYSDTAVQFSVVLRPAVRVKRGRFICNNNVELPLSNYTQFPLIFNSSELVFIENIDFIGCMRPVQILWVKNTTMFNVTFRYDDYM